MITGCYYVVDSRTSENVHDGARVTQAYDAVGNRGQWLRSTAMRADGDRGILADLAIPPRRCEARRALRRASGFESFIFRTSCRDHYPVSAGIRKSWAIAVCTRQARIDTLRSNFCVGGDVSIRHGAASSALRCTIRLILALLIVGSAADLRLSSADEPVVRRGCSEGSWADSLRQAKDDVRHALRTKYKGATRFSCSGPKLRHLLAGLVHSNRVIREIAEKALISLGDEIRDGRHRQTTGLRFGALPTVFGYEEMTQRARAVLALYDLDAILSLDPGGRPGRSLISALHDDSDPMVREAVVALGGFDLVSSFEMTRRGLRDSSGRVRATAVVVMHMHFGLYSSLQWEGVMTSALCDPDSKVRQVAAASIADVQPIGLKFDGSAKVVECIRADLRSRPLTPAHELFVRTAQALKGGGVHFVPDITELLQDAFVLADAERQDDVAGNWRFRLPGAALEALADFGDEVLLSAAEVERLLNGRGIDSDEGLLVLASSISGEFARQRQGKIEEILRGLESDANAYDPFGWLCGRAILNSANDRASLERAIGSVLSSASMSAKAAAVEDVLRRQYRSEECDREIPTMLIKYLHMPPKLRLAAAKYCLQAGIREKEALQVLKQLSLCSPEGPNPIGEGFIDEEAVDALGAQAGVSEDARNVLESVAGEFAQREASPRLEIALLKHLCTSRSARSLTVLRDLANARLTSEGETTFHFAIQQLAQQGVLASELLIAAARKGEAASVRLAAVQMLGEPQWEGTEVEKALRERQVDIDETVQAAAAKSLQRRHPQHGRRRPWPMYTCKTRPQHGVFWKKRCGR